MPLPRQTQALASSLNSHRILLYTLLSISAVGVAVLNALQNYSNFYSIAIYLSKSSRSVLVFANFGVLLALLCGHIVQIIFFGSLRANEVERLYDRLWFFITESLLAFTIFRDEFDIPFLLMFGFLLFVKSFHWLAGDRIEWMDQRPYPGPGTLFHIRMGTLFVILWTTDLLMFLIAVENTLSHGVGGMVLFASEYGILMASIGNTIAKYLLSSYELRRAARRGGENAPPWENKSMWLFYIELTTDFIKLLTYLLFFGVIITYYGLPLNIVRDVYITARSLISRIGALRRYQSATRNMDQRYPNATEEEMSAMTDRTCIICREEMTPPTAPQATQGTPTDGPNTTPKKLPCGHIFHFHCLRSWLERQQSCPTCRRSVLENAPTQPANGANPGALGGVPRQANAPPDVAPQNIPAPGANNPLGNPLGLVGRIFGPQGQQQQQPPGQFIPAHVPAPGIVNPPINTDNNVNHHSQNQQPAVIIQYCIHYQAPQNRTRADRGSALRPPPVFQGFMGPGGVWQPWHMPGDGEREGARQERETQAEGRNDNQITNPSTAHVPVPTPTDSRTSAETETTSSSPSASSPSNVDPREAARLAALRRHGFEPTINQTPDSSAANPEPTTAQSTSRLTQSSIHTTASSGAHPQQHSRTHDLRPPRTGNETDLRHLPRLIPMYDPSQVVAPSSTHYDSTALHSSNRSSNLPYHRPTSLTTGTNSPTSLASLPPSLPPTLTDEQLSVMDSLTREAIDERLRVLDGVSTSVHRCIEDLMRMRSALPIVQAQTQTQYQTQPQPQPRTHHFGNVERARPSSVENPTTAPSARVADAAGGAHTTPGADPSTLGNTNASFGPKSISSSWASGGGYSLSDNDVGTSSQAGLRGSVRVQDASASESESDSGDSSSFDDL
ncbi:hypothetical protein AX16_001884 [Volvariella volvacea WC 439]|nr:hypothetical protein AX16_001884 [Volvariella volvacea WC 439]